MVVPGVGESVVICIEGGAVSIIALGARVSTTRRLGSCVIGTLVVSPGDGAIVVTLEVGAIVSMPSSMVGGAVTGGPLVGRGVGALVAAMGASVVGASVMGASVTGGTVGAGEVEGVSVSSSQMYLLLLVLLDLLLFLDLLWLCELLELLDPLLLFLFDEDDDDDDPFKNR